jgi:hypothetical protein
VHDIGVVEVDGESSGAANPCLAAEGTWAGAGLNLYTFLTNSGLCTSTATCFTVGYNAGIHAFEDAQAAGVNTSVAWWLDVEGAGQYWTSSTAQNAQTVLGAIDALHNTEGVADVGIYASPGTWNGIVGNYQPSVPYWMADWLTPPSGPSTCAAVAGWESKEQLPTGPVEFVQYSDSINGADGLTGAHGLAGVIAVGTPAASLNRMSTQRDSVGIHSHSVRDACTMRVHPRRDTAGGISRNEIMVDSITPAWTAATTNSPGCRTASAHTAAEARATKAVQLSPPGAITVSGSVSHSGTPKRSTTSCQPSPSDSPGCSSHNAQSCTTSSVPPLTTG